MIISQISIFLQNKPGSFCAVAKVLSDHAINMRAMSVADTSDFGILRIIVDNNEKACAVLQEAGYIFRETPVVAVEVNDKPGALVSILELLGKENISLEYMYAFPTKKEDSAYMIFRVDDAEATVSVLQKAGINVIGKAEIDTI